MKYFVTLDDEEYEVELVREAGGRFKVRLGERERQVDLETIEPGRRYSILLDRDSHDLSVDASGGRLQLMVGGRRIDALVEDERQRSARRIAAHAPRGPVTIESAMPGILREVRVEVGQSVEAGATLVILEAMKMENEIVAEQPGVVREILAQAGTAVEGGAPLIVLDPPESEEEGAEG